MVYYHLFIQYKNKEDKTTKVYVLGYGEKNFEKYVAKPYNENRPFLATSEEVIRDRIDRIDVFSSNIQDIREKLLPNGKKINEEGNVEYIWKCFSSGKIPEILGIATGRLLQPQEKPSLAKKSLLKPSSKTEKIFIVNGRDETPALALQKHLAKDLHLDAEMFEDFKKTITSGTVIGTLEEIRDQIGFAFIVVTPDDLGCFCDDVEECEKEILLKGEDISAKDVHKLRCQLNTRARQNVVFEHGLFMGALGREKVCCLLQTKTKEKPSDLSGVLYEEFDKRVSEKFTEIDAKLEKLGLTKK